MVTKIVRSIYIYIYIYVCSSDLSSSDRSFLNLLCILATHFHLVAEVTSWEQMSITCTCDVWSCVLFTDTPAAAHLSKIRLGLTLAFNVEALTHLGCCLQAFCCIWSALGKPGLPNWLFGVSVQAAAPVSGPGNGGGAGALAACGNLWQPAAD